jgi:hypothetical protein
VSLPGPGQACRALAQQGRRRARRPASWTSSPRHCWDGACITAGRCSTGCPRRAGSATVCHRLFVTLTPRRALPAVRGSHPPMPEHNTHIERTPDASGGYAWYGRCSCGWHGDLRVSEQGARHDATAHRTNATPHVRDKRGRMTPAGLAIGRETHGVCVCRFEQQQPHRWRRDCLGQEH